MNLVGVVLGVVLYIWEFALWRPFTGIPRNLPHSGGNATAPVAGAGVQLDLSPFFNAKAAAQGPDDTFADFDGSRRAFPAEWLPSGLSFVHDGIQFALPPFHARRRFDTVRSDAQTISLHQRELSRIHSFHALATAVWPAGDSSQYRKGTVTFTFTDGTEDRASFVVGPWYNMNPFDGPISTPFHFANATLDGGKSVDYNVTSISYVSTHVSSAKPLKSITLPEKSTYINFFAISLLQALPPDAAEQVHISVQNVRSTTKWLDDDSLAALERMGNTKVQSLEITLNNLAPLNAPHSTWLISRHNATVRVVSDALDTVVVGRVQRLRSNDQVVVRVGVRNRPGVKPGTKVRVSVEMDSAASGKVVLDGGEDWQVVAGIPEWTNDDASLKTHEAPDWFHDAKFGIFVHWGVYSVPAWAPSGLQYAEWYNWQLHNPSDGDSPTRIHHLRTYGNGTVYDDFIANWTASAWKPEDWLDLFSAAGAKYFVLVTKHHDGFALFDTGRSSDRNSLLLGPGRNVVKELFDTAKAKYPELHRGTYYSIPEWFHPEWARYAMQNFPGGPATNAFNGSCCDPYLGYVPVDDFLTGVQKPQMETLFYEHDTEILWCDIGGASIFPDIGAAWYNYAALQGRQVVMNNRCGANQSDFVTPEYARLGAPLSQKWESSAGLDPHSYGYNSDTPSDAYQNASSIVIELIDIVSKGGNFLLDIGPMQDGTVIPEERGPLLEVGTWLSHSGPAIFRTRPWFVQQEDITPGRTDVRFTVSDSAFYILAISRPRGELKTAAPVPLTEGDEVTLLGGSGARLAWHVDEEGVLRVCVSDEELDMVNLPAWAFQVAYAL